MLQVCLWQLVTPVICVCLCVDVRGRAEEAVSDFRSLSLVRSLNSKQAILTRRDTQEYLHKPFSFEFTSDSPAMYQISVFCSDK